MKNEGTGFPVQKVSIKKKTKQWRESCVRYIVGTADSNISSSDRVSKADMQSYYDLYNSKYDEKRLRYVTNPFKQDDGFPATAQNLNIIKPQVDLLVGENAAKPFDFTVVRTSESTTSEVQDAMKTMLTDYMVSAMYANMSEEDAMIHQEKLESGEIQLPEQIQDYFSKSYKDVGESIADKSLKYLRRKLNLEKVFETGMFDALVSSEELYFVGERGGQPICERVNPLSFDYETSPDLEYIHDAGWCARKIRTSVQKIYDGYFDKLSEKEHNQLLERLKSGSLSRAKSEGNHSGIRYVDSVEALSRSSSSEDPNLVDLWHVCWQSYKKIGFVTLITEDGEMEEVQVDESYYVTGDEVDIEWEWALETWEGYWVDEEINFGIQPINYQYVSGNNLNATRLPYTGAVYYNANAKPKSFVSFLEPLQYTYIMLWYRLELALARDKGKVLTMDITQIPKTYDVDVAKWMHMLSALGVNLINPYEEGWDVQGRGGGRASNFQNFSAADLSMSNTIASYIELLDKVEAMAMSLTGITPQRKGDVQTKELVGNVERSIVQSSNITEGLNSKHNYIMQEALNMLLNVTKNVWINSNPGELNYVLDDGERIFLEITDDFLYSDFDIFVTNSRDELAKLEQLKSLYQPAMQNGASLSDIAEIMSIGNISKIKQALRKTEEKRQELEQQAQEAERESNMQLEEVRRQVVEAQIQDKEADRENARLIAEMDNNTKVRVAMINAYRYQEDLDVDNDGIADPIQIGELALKQQGLEADRHDKEANRSAKREETHTKTKLERDKLIAAKELQKQKDDAAYKREQLKATTALKNPVVGENKKKTK